MAVATVTQPRRGSAAPAAAQAPAPLIPFTRAAYEHIEGPFGPPAVLMDGNTHVLQFPDIPAHGFMGDIVIQVVGSGGAGGAAVAAADAPWNVLDNISLVDTSLVPIVGPLSGYDLYLLNLLGGYNFSASINAENGGTAAPPFSAIDANGNFTFLLRIPVQLSNRDAVGALANQTASAPYRLTATLQANTTVYGVIPAGAQPLVTVSCWLESWSQPAAADNGGNRQAVEPPALGTTQFWSVQIDNLANGFNDWRLQKMGYLLRTVIMQFRTTAAGNPRSNANIPPSLNWLVDGQQRESGNAPAILRNRTFMRTNGIVVPTGVLVWDFTHELSGHIGDDLRDLLVPTTPATNWRYQGTFGAATVLRTLVNDVSVPQGKSIYLGA